MPDPIPMIRLRDIRRRFRCPGGAEFVAVDVPRLDLAAGERLVVTGPNGAGKTTLLHLLSGLLRVDEGRVEVAGHDLGALREPQLDRFRGRTVGYLLQRPLLLEGLSAEHNVMAAMLFAGASRAAQRERARELLERLGVDHRSRHRPSALSGGERQRVALARALANDPALLLADEPTAALDPSGAAQLLGDLDRLVREGGRTLVLVTHRPDEIPGDGPTLAMEPGKPSAETRS